MASNTASFGRRGAARPASPKPARPPQPVTPATEAVPHPPGRVARFLARIPWLTLVLCFILGTRFNAELQRATDFDAPNAPGHFTLLAMGGADRALVFGQGEVWRLFTASALHASPAHLIGNLITLLTVGFLLEPLIGIGWFAAIYFTGAFAGQLISTLMNGADTLSVGASGAIMAMLAALFSLSFHVGARRPAAMRRVAATSIFPALIPNVSHGTITDINAHLGGCMAGIAIAMVLLAAWREEDVHPPGRSIAAVIAGCWAALTVWAFITGSHSFARYARDGLDYIPPSALPPNLEMTSEASLGLVEKYPKDPRSHLYRGIYFLEVGQYANGESYFRDAARMANGNPLSTQDFRNWALSLLALDILAQDRVTQAKTMAAPLCDLANPDIHTQKALALGRLCVTAAP